MRASQLAGLYFLFGVIAGIACIGIGSDNVPEVMRAMPAAVLGLGVISGCLFLGCAHLMAHRRKD